MPKVISSNQLEKLIETYLKRGGEILQINEGVLTSGDFLLFADTSLKLKFIVVKEFYLNQWSSCQTIRMYNKIPKKYQKIISSI